MVAWLSQIGKAVLAIGGGSGYVRLTVGQTLVSAVDQTTVVVVRAPADDVVLTCGGESMAPPGESPNKPTALASSEQREGTLLGKRYADDSIELLCTKAGSGTLARDGVPLRVREAKALPASD